MIRKPDRVSDAFIGVSFRDRPSVAQVEKAKKKVKGLVGKIEELMGHKASSDVEVWSVVTRAFLRGNFRRSTDA